METHEEFLSHVLGAPQDVSLPILNDLLKKGYTTVTWHSNPGTTHAECLAKDGDSWPLKVFVSGLHHQAPVFEKTHVGCKCSIEVSGPGKPPVVLTAFGVES